MTKRRVMDPDGKRAAIMASAERLFAEKGYTRATIADVADAAGVAVGSVYRLFPDKPALLAALHQRMEQRFVDVMKKGWGEAEHYADRFAPMIEGLLKETERLREIMPLYAMTKDMAGATDYVPNALMIEAISRLYTDGVAAGAFRKIDPSVQAHLGFAMVEGGIRAWMANPSKQRMKAVTKELAEVFRRAFVKT
ncbi:MAG: TetR/AcrR family transcriptional regulator [Pseudomonadota bacterium]